MEYLETDAGQIIAGAHCYLSAAGVLRESDAYRRRQSVLAKPTLHVLAHGIELLLKFPLLRAGASAAEVRSYGHRLMDLWREPRTLTLRGLLNARAREAWAAAAAAGAWPHDDFSADPVEQLESALGRLSELHGRETDFALRYLIEPNTAAPPAAFLVDTFAPVAEAVLKRPALLDITERAISGDAPRKSGEQSGEGFP